jgi:sterol desaturase/sphingolipid hydroxylase (fatty acid hydroxylase superfamily)
MWLAWIEAFVSKRMGALWLRAEDALYFGGLCFLFFYLAGKLAKVPGGQYTSRSFLHDLFFWFYYRLGIHTFIFSYWLFSYVGPALPKWNLLEGWSYWLRFLIYYLVADFLGYWLHRLRHKAKVLWAFHTTHHSVERMTYATELRTHPVEMFIAETMMYIPLFLLGAAPEYWAPLAILRAMSEVAQHSELPWRFGPLYYVFVSPAFHAVHHSVKQEHFDRNFGVNLSAWDFLFGTAVDAKQLPERYGLPDVKMPDLSSQMFLPFRLIYDSYFKRPIEAEHSAAAAAKQSS